MKEPDPSAPEPTASFGAESTMVVAGQALRAFRAEAEAREHHLVVVEGWQVGLRVVLSDKPLRLGRGAANDLAIPDSQVSGTHCQITASASQPNAVLQDLNSTNGSFIEDQRVSGAAPWPPGVLLRIGSQVLRHEYLLKSEATKLLEHERDVDKARSYVRSLLPPPITEGPVRTDWYYLPSTDLGGDAFGYHRLSDTCFAGYLIDISGHGVGAAMHSVSVMNVLRQRALPGVDFADPAQVLRGLNEMFQMDSHNGMYFSAWYGVYDVALRTLRFASAGHHPAYLVDAQRSASTPLQTRNMVIGAMAGLAFKAQEVQVAPGSTVYVFSDGAFEVTTKEGAQWGLPDFLPLLLAPERPGQEALRLYEAVRAVARPGTLEDDFSILVVTFS